MRILLKRLKSFCWNLLKISDFLYLWKSCNQRNSLAQLPSKINIIKFIIEIKRDFIVSIIHFYTNSYNSKVDRKLI